MKSFSEFIKESVFDEIPTAKLNKQLIDKVKVWVKTIDKSSGRIKFDQKNMKVLLPSHACLTIPCPIPNSITLEIDDDNSKYYTNLTLINATDDDIDKVKHLQMKSKSLRNSYITHMPQEWSSIDSDISILNPNNNIDLSNLSEIRSIYISSVKKVKIFGIENIKVARHIQFVNITVDGIFKKLKETSMDMDRVECDVNLFKNVNNIINKEGKGQGPIKFEKCLVDLSNITKYEGDMWLRYISDLKGEFLPKYIHTLKILDENVGVEDLLNINLSNVDNLIVKCLNYINPHILKDKEAVRIFVNFYQFVKNNGESVPQEIIDYFVKNTKRIKYNDVKNNEEYFVIPHDWSNKSEYISMYKIKGSVIMDEITNKPSPFNVCNDYEYFGYMDWSHMWGSGEGWNDDLVNTFVKGEDAYIFKINDKVKPLADSIMNFKRKNPRSY